MERKTNTHITTESRETDREREKRLDQEESTKKLKAIIFVVIPLLIAFLAFSYFFLNSLEQKSKLLEIQTKAESSQEAE